MWGITSDFGNSMFRWIVTSVAIALIFGAIYSGYIDTTRFFEQPELIYTHDDNKPPPDKLTCYYYSVVTFTTLGFGDVVPVNDSGRIAVMIEVILGYIMLGGLISLFANKFVRRE